MVGADGVADFRFLLAALGNLHAENSVWQFGLFVGHLAYVVQQPGATCFLGVQAKFRGHDGAEIGGLAGMLKKILAVARTIFHLAYHADKVGMQPVNAEVDGSTLAGLYDFFLNLLAHFVYYLLNACGMDAAVGHELMERQAGDFAAHRVEAGEHDGLGGIVDDNLNACSGLKGADVAALAADDAALDFIAVDMEHRHGILDCGFGSNALDCLNHDTLGLLVGRHPGFVHYFVHILGGSRFGLVLERLHEFLLGFLRR